MAGTCGDPRPSPAVAFGGPSVGLTLRALVFQPLSFAPVAVCAVIGGIAITFLHVETGPGDTKNRLAVTFTQPGQQHFHLVSGCVHKPDSHSGGAGIHHPRPGAE